MNTAAADRIAKAVLYEGYMLYPYRPSALKNQQRFNFGVVYPQIFSDEQNGTDPWIMRTECLVQGSVLSRIEVRVRFLQLVERSVHQLVDGAFRPVKSLRVDSDTFYSWQEAIERELSLPPTDVDLLNRHPILHPFQLSSQTTEEAVRDSRNSDGGPHRAESAGDQWLAFRCGSSCRGKHLQDQRAGQEFHAHRKRSQPRATP